MTHPACSAEALEAHAGGPARAAFFCVFHLIAGVAAALLAFGALALVTPMN